MSRVSGPRAPELSSIDENGGGPWGRASKSQSLSLRSRAATARQIEQLARKIGGDSEDELILEHARNAAQVTIDLARVKRVRVALIERASALGGVESPRLFRSAAEARRFLLSIERGECQSCRNASASRRRCLRNSRSAPPKPCDAPCHTWPSLIVTNPDAARGDKALWEIATSR